MAAEKLSEADIQVRLGTLPHWHIENNALVRTISFLNFLIAISFVNAIAHLAERQNHHPDIDIRYQTVTLRYWTHTAKGITDFDFIGAQACESYIKQFQKGPPVKA